MVGCIKPIFDDNSLSKNELRMSGNNIVIAIYQKNWKMLYNPYYPVPEKL
jgi:hypothetical protein